MLSQLTAVLPEAPDLKGYLRIAGLTALGAGFVYTVASIGNHGEAAYFKERRSFLRESRIQALTTLKHELMNEEKGFKMDILKLSMKDLLAKMRQGELSAKEVLKVYQTQALKAHEATNCLTGSISEGGPLALERDQDPDKSKPLHGIPISIKDNIPVKGYANSIGLSRLCDNIIEEDAFLVQVLKKQGAVPFVLTGFPQLLMAYESSNPIFGAVRNPHDLLRGAGGSSGGEAALIASGGSLLGFGTDIAGSIRLPCAFCGICGLKPTCDRIGYPYPEKAQSIIRPNVGPMARDVDSLALAMRAILVPELFEKDQRMPPIPFREDIFQSTQRLTIGYYTDDLVCPACPSSARAVMIAKQALEAAGHTLVPWTPLDAKFAVRAEIRSLAGDQGATILKLLGNDVIDPSVLPYVFCMTLSRISRFFQCLYHRYVRHKPRLAKFLADFKGQKSVSEWWAWTIEVAQYRERFSAYWNETGVDAVICPAFTFPSLKLGSPFQLIRNGNYMFLWNATNMPAGVVPVTRVTKDDIYALDAWAATDEDGPYVLDDQQEAEGMPVCVQVAGARWNEELVLRVMKEVEGRVNYRK